MAYRRVYVDVRLRGVIDLPAQALENIRSYPPDTWDRTIAPLVFEVISQVGGELDCELEDWYEAGD